MSADPLTNGATPASSSSSSSNRRIQLLRERLELYNASIAEAMGVVAGVASMERRGAAQSRDVGPRPDRDLAADFNAARAVARAAAAEGSEGDTDTEAAWPAGMKRMAPRPSPLRTTVNANAANSGVGACGTSSGRTSATATSEALCAAATTTAAATAVALSLYSDSDSGSGSDSESGGGNEYVNVFLNVPVVVGASLASGNGDGKVLANGASIGEEGEEEEEEQKEKRGEGEEKEKEKDDDDEEEVRFADLEAAHHRLATTEQAALRLRALVDSDRFPAALPQRLAAARLSDARDELVRREQFARRAFAAAGGRALSEIRATDAAAADREARRLVADCGAARAHFGRVEARRAAVAEKERLLRRRLAELEDRQRDVRERRAALAVLERRTEQRGAHIGAREDSHRQDVAAHKRREAEVRAKEGAVEALGQRVASWLKILEARNAELAAKEARLRRVQSDLVRRSEELHSYRNGKARQPQQRT